MAKDLGWKSRRLTVAMREQILNRVTDDKLSGRSAALQDARRVLAGDIYDLFMGAYAKKIKSLPESFFQRHSTIKVRIGGSLETLQLDKARPVPFYAAYGSALGDLDITDDLVVRDNKHNDIQTKINKDRTEIISTIRPILFSARNENHLLELWPGALKYMKAPKPEAAPPVPRCEAADDLLAALDKINAKVPA